jgi:outer membrane receptor protein involved in Fe transport
MNLVGTSARRRRGLSLLNDTALRTAAIAAIAGSFAMPALAQETKADQPPPEALQSEQEAESGQAAPSCQVPAGTPLPPGCTPATNEGITVTGSRIRRPNLESPLPVTSVGGQEFFETGNVSVGDKLAELPSIRSTYTQANSTRFLGTAGLNLLDLRGLGTVRTLVLVNGRRHVGGDVLSSGVSVDVNTIPTDLIDRVDVVTGGNSAVYGSDAVAGVVNFVLKQDYDGIMLRGQGGISKYGDAGSEFVSGLFGRNFADGRGNVAVNLEYSRRDQAWGHDRPWYRENYTFNATSPTLIPNPDWRSATFNNTGNIRFATGQCGQDANGTPYFCPFIFQPNGDLVPQTGQRIGLGPNGDFVGGNGEGFFEGHQVQITPNLDRYSANLIGHYEITPAVVPFVEAKFSRTDSSGTGGSGPGFLTGVGAGLPFDPFQYVQYNRVRISINNPFLSPQARQTIIDQRALSGLGTNDNTRFTIQEGLLGLGNRTEDARRDTFRIVGGLRGDIGSSWNYEVSLNYGQLKENTKIKGNMDVQRLLLALDAVRDQNGNIVCRSQIDPSAAFGYWPWVYGTDYFGPDHPVPGDPNAPARLANDVSQCVPINPLGGNISQAAKDYVLLDTVTKASTSQLDLLAFISGDSSKWFELPGGPVGLVLGAEYRANDIFYQQDPQVELGYTFYNKIGRFDPAKVKVKEAFGEIRLPIIKDLPGLRELEVSAAARVSDYNTSGSVWAYNVNGVWSPLQGLRFRGNYARSVRAPNQVELFFPFSQNYRLITDPCDKNAVNLGSANRPANCLAAGIPAGTVIQYTSSLPYLSGGYPFLKPETSKSITLGGVFTPAFLPGASLSVDYYKIRVDDVITSPTVQQFLNACYDLPSIENPFCAGFQRAGPSGQGGHSGVNYGIIPNSLHLTSLNYAKLQNRGIDIEAAYRHRLGNIGRIDTRFTWTHVFELTQYIDPTNPKYGDRILSELGDPEDAFNWNTSLQHGRFTFGYQMRFVGKQIRYSERFGLGAYEDFYSFQGRDAENPDLFAKAWFPSKFYHDVRMGIDVGPKYNFYMGIDNLTDTRPPFALSGLGGQSAIYDVYGRFFYAGVSAKF